MSAIPPEPQVVKTFLRANPGTRAERALAAFAKAGAESVQKAREVAGHLGEVARGSRSRCPVGVFADVAPKGWFHDPEHDGLIRPDPKHPIGKEFLAKFRKLKGPSVEKLIEKLRLQRAPVFIETEDFGGWMMPRFGAGVWNGIGHIVCYSKPDCDVEWFREPECPEGFHVVETPK